MKKGLIAVFLAIVACAVCLSLGVDFATRTVHARTAAFHVVIDAGHGGRDGGATSPRGVKESELALAISKFLAKEFRSRGVGVTLTRETGDSLANPYAKNQKKSDMEARRKIIEKVAPDLVLSIHLNSLPSSPATRGLQAFYDKTGEQSKIYAESIQSEFNKSNLATNRRATTGDFFMLECTQFPSVLIECGFLSNPTDEKLLQSPEYQKILAFYIANAVMK